MTITRRAALRHLLLGAGILATGATCSSSAAPSKRKRVAIVGGGAAGVMTAWLLDGAFDVVLLEGRAVLGGNVQTIDVDVRGQSATVDVGAQYFHPGPYPTYVSLLQVLGLYDPADPGTGSSFSAPSSITVYADGEANPRFVSPVFPDRTWPLQASWNVDGLIAFGTVSPAAVTYDKNDSDWLVTLEDWLSSLSLSDTQRNDIVVPWVSSLFSGDLPQGATLSARASLVFLSRAYQRPTDNINYYTLRQGMVSVLETMKSQCTTLQTRTHARVVGLSKSQRGFVVSATDGSAVDADLVIFASPAEDTAKVLAFTPGFDSQLSALRAFEWTDTTIAIHRDGVYAPADPMLQSFLNCQVRGATCEASMNLASVLAPLSDGPVDLWKSWTTHRETHPADVVHEASYRHMLPTPATIRAQRALAELQGQRGVFFVGGYTMPYDAQESALLSALTLANTLLVDTEHVGVLKAKSAQG